MPDQFFYTAIFRPSSSEILTSADGVPYAEHFVDEVERNKRARQFEAHARSLGDVDPWMVYMGKESLERNRAREDFRAYDPEAETPEEFYKEMDAEVSKITKTVSVLTAPEIDDSQEARPLPAWAVAQAEVERAELAVSDAKDIVAEYTSRADALDERALSTKSDRAPMDPSLRLAAEGARGEVEQARGRLYQAEQNLEAAKAKLASVMPKEGKDA